MELKQKAISSVRWTGLSSILLMIIGIAQILVLARLIPKKEFGLMAISNVIIGLASSVIDLGTSNAIIFKQDIEHKQLSTLYWLNVFSGFIIFLIVCLLAPAIALFYNEPFLTNVIILIAVCFPLSALGNQFQVLLRKNMMFKELFIVDLITNVTAFVVTIVLAIKWANVFALAIGAVIRSALSSLLCFIYGVKLNRPSFHFNYKEVSFFFKFGAFQVGETIVNYFNYQFDSLLIGKLLGMEVLGAYDILKRLIVRPYNILAPVISKVSFPLMSQANTDDVLLKKIYLRIIGQVVAFLAPIYIAAAICSKPFLVVWLGTSWQQYSLIFSLLAILYILISVSNPIGSLQLAKGRADMGFYWNLSLFFVTPLVVIVGNYTGGISGILTMMIVEHVFLLALEYLLFIKKLVAINWKEYLMSMVRPMGVILFSAIVCAALLFFFSKPLPKLIIFTVAFGMIYLIINYFLKTIFLMDLFSFLGYKKKRIYND